MRMTMTVGQRRRFKQNIPLLVMFAPVAVFFILFKYVPMGGIIIAFKNFNLIQGVWGSPWAGLGNFKALLDNPFTFNIIRNTFILSILSIVFGFPLPIVLAIMLNEVRNKLFKSSVQTLVYLPHFLNWVIVGGIVITMFSMENGIVNHWVEKLTGSVYPFLYNEGTWIAIFIGSGVWKTAGWGAIIYLAALSSIDASLYEAANLDGANKLQQIWHITIPGISSTIIVMLILSMGQVMEVGFDPVYILGNPVVATSIADVISTYTYRIGLQGGQFSLASAIGFFESLVGLVLVTAANYAARRFGQGLW